MSTPGEVTQLLAECGNGNKEAFDRLIPLVYDELHRLARRSLASERPNHTLQTTALVNEAYMKLVGQENMRWENRAHFYAIAARLLRRILVDHARTKYREKRGGGANKLSLESDAQISVAPDQDLVALDDALNALANIDERKCRIVEMKFFGGLTAEEIGQVLGISAVTVVRDWSFAKAWLYRELSAQ